jgi:hypothetical protein
VLDVPEVNVAIFAFLLNFVWEFAQVPLYAGMATAEHWPAIVVCGSATVGDVVIALVGFWSVAVVTGSRDWIGRPGWRQLAGFVVTGVLVTSVIEVLATRVIHRWAYAPAMPVVPVIDVGIVPLLQWIVVPPLIVWFVRRQLGTGSR